MEPREFIRKWTGATLKERSAAQEHFIDLCRLLGEPTPVEADPAGERYCFERGTRKDGGRKGWADVWKRGCFAWEYKGRHADLDAAFNQLRQYVLGLENPPLLIVSDLARFRIRTNWTNTVSKTYEITLEELVDAAVRDKLKWAMSDPERLRPGETRQALTEKVAATFAGLAHGLRERGHEPQAVAHFVNRLVFCMFAEDAGLLPDRMFTRILKEAKETPGDFTGLAGGLFKAMSRGERFGIDQIAWFNGDLFNDAQALPLEHAEIETALAAAALDWSEIDPSILGILFERGLDPDKRAQLGAHYTDRDKVMLIVEPVIVRPLLAEWEGVKAGIAAELKRAEAARSKAAETRRRGEAERRYGRFLARLRAFTVLDPACGSGNFLYLALHALKDLEHRVQLEAEEMGLQRAFPEVGPANVRGIEINAYAAELARVSVWIGEIQWMRRNGFNESRDPILKPLETIECRDAILTPEGEEPEWPKTDVVIGNPPFLGGKLLRRGLGGEYVEALRRVYGVRLHGEADLVCHWVDKAQRMLEDGRAARAGLVATNSIRGGRNRSVLDRVAERGRIFDAWSDEPWVVDGAAVRVSLVAFEVAADDAPVVLDGKPVTRIHADLTAGAVDASRISRIVENRCASFTGGIRNGPFDIPGDIAREWLRLPVNPNGRPNSDVLRPWRSGTDLVQEPKDRWIIDFGASSLEDAALYEAPFTHVEKYVKPLRAEKGDRKLREYWWRHEAPRSGMWLAIGGKPRYIATPNVAKHRLFIWLNSRIVPDGRLIIISRDDDATFGILHSRFHEAWALWLGNTLEDRPCYSPTACFQTFPFPEGLSPDIPAVDYADDPRARHIADAAQRLVAQRNQWLHPSDCVTWEDEPAAGYPKRPVPRNEEAARRIKGRTLTNLYNERPQWLANAHAALDAAVAAAYGWPDDLSEEDALGRLLALNTARSGRNGG